MKMPSLLITPSANKTPFEILWFALVEAAVINSMGSMASSMNFMASWWVPMVLCRESNWICWALFSTARVMGIAAMSPIAPMMAMVISPTALLPNHVTFDPVDSVSSLLLIWSSSVIRKSSCFVSVAQAEFNAQNASSILFMADLMCECMPAMVFSHRSLAVST